jgi:hypothetical protein
LGWNTISNGSGTSYANGASYTIGSSNVTLYAQWNISLSSCGNLSAGSYSLTQSVSSSGTCFSLPASGDVTLDCHNYEILGSSASYAFQASTNGLNLTLKNCRVSGFTYDASFSGTNIGYSSGNLYLFNSSLNTVVLDGVNGNPGGGWGGWGGNARLASSTISTIYSRGGYAYTGSECYPYDTGGNGGSVYLSSSSAVGSYYLTGGGYYNGPAAGCGASGSDGSVSSGLTCEQACSGSPDCVAACY